MSGTKTRAHGRITGRTAARASRAQRRHLRVRKKVEGSAARPRLVVTRSARNMFAQLVDDVAGGHAGLRVDPGRVHPRRRRRQDAPRRKQVGALLAERATQAGITAAVFDRGGHAYHGRIAALADGAREGGLAL